MRWSSTTWASNPRPVIRAASAVAVSSAGLMAGPAFGHSAERGLILLLPTEQTMVGSALAVAISFVLLALIPPTWVTRLSTGKYRLATIPAIPEVPFSMAAFMFLCLLLVAGFSGSPDPLLNPLPLTAWTLWWVLFTVLQCVTGNLWRHLNPWTGPVWLSRRILGLKPVYRRLPSGLGYAPAIVLFAAFAWFELVYPAPQEPYRLALVISIYWLLNFVAMLICGTDPWLQRGEPFAVFFRLVGQLSPLRVSNIRRAGFQPALEKQDTILSHARWELNLVLPGTRFADLPALPLSGILFVLLTLGTVSFDGLARTFVWLGNAGINPLAFPGRSAMVTLNSVGLVLAVATLVGLYFGCVYGGCRYINQGNQFRLAAGRLVYSLIPISLVFHLAHYLTVALVNTQYALRAYNDPFNLGWNLLAAEHFHVTTSFFNYIEAVTAIWNFQTAVIVIGHASGILSAHIIAMALFKGSRDTTQSQIFLAALMVCYTVFGLWLLATPAVG